MNLNLCSEPKIAIKVGSKPYSKVISGIRTAGKEKIVSDAVESVEMVRLCSSQCIKFNILYPGA